MLVVLLSLLVMFDVFCYLLRGVVYAWRLFVSGLGVCDRSSLCNVIVRLCWLRWLCCVVGSMSLICVFRGVVMCFVLYCMRGGYLGHVDAFAIAVCSAFCLFSCAGRTSWFA